MKLTKLYLGRAVSTLAILSILFFGNIEQAFASSAPSATNMNAAETYTEDTPLNLIDIVVSDTDSAVTTVTLTLSDPSAGSLTTGTSGAVTSTYNSGTGTWLASGAIADVNSLLAGVNFIPTLNYNSAFTIAVSITDDTSNNITGSKNVIGIAVNDAPTATNLNAAQTYSQNTTLNLIDIVASDVDSSNITATLTLSSSTLGSLSTGTSGSVTSTYDSGTGVWTASGAISSVNALLASVTFVPALNATSNLTIGTSISDGIATITGTKNITGVATNSAPALDATKSPVLSTISEDASAPTGSVGTLVSSLVDFSAPSGQVDNVTDSDGGALLGVAITATDASLTCYYSLNDGATWTSMGSVSNTSARLLAADSDNRIYCRAGLNANGTFTSALTMRAWDQTTGVDGGLADTSSNGGVTAFSSATDTVRLIVTAVNDAPTATNLSTDETYYEDIPAALTDIVVSDVDSTTVTATLTLSSTTVGILTTNTSGAVTSTYDSGTGVWTASGAIADVNAVLATVSFRPTASSTANFTISTNVSDGSLSVSGTKTITAIPTVFTSPSAGGCSSTITTVNGLTYTTTCGVTTVTGTPTVVTSTTSASSGGSSSSGGAGVSNTASSVAQSTTSTGGASVNSTNPVKPAYQFPRNLKKGMSGDDVLKLQQFLNAKGFVISISGPGSVGNETTSFGGKTESALMKFQTAYTRDILASQNIAKPTGWFYTYTRAFVNKMIMAEKGAPISPANSSTNNTNPTSPKNATYIIDGNSVTLVNGVSSVPAAPGSASMITTQYFGNEYNYDFNGDNRVDTAFILTQSTGGSGVFYYAVIALNTNSGYIGSSAYLLGDRIAPQSMSISQNKNSGAVLVVNYVDRKVGEPMTTAPSVGKSLNLKLDPKTMSLAQSI